MLDLAEQAGLGPVQSHDIALRQGIPEPYLNQILTLLRRAGLIASRRGPGGGHTLSRSPGAITLADLVSALEGPLWPPEEAPSGRRRSEVRQSLREVWEEVARSVDGVLSRVTLADVVEREQRRVLTYHI